MIDQQIPIFSRAIRFILILFIVGGRPLLGPPCHCRYLVSCTDYAVFQLENQKLLFVAIWSIIKRLASCHPFHRQKQANKS